MERSCVPVALDMHGPTPSVATSEARRQPLWLEEIADGKYSQRPFFFCTDQKNKAASSALPIFASFAAGRKPPIPLPVKRRCRGITHSLTSR
jgi:hypothetical protein